MTDQLVGQVMAHICGLGDMLNPENVSAALKSIMKYSFLADLFSHANPIRAFALQDEQMLAYGSYPKGAMPERPCFRFFENWTGVEYAAAVLMIQMGMMEEGLKIFRAVRSRFDGRKRNPFDEPECGHHYARAMASWGAVIALTGFSYSAVAQSLEIKAAGEPGADVPAAAAHGGEKPSTQFWSNGYAWGTITQVREDSRIKVTIVVEEGSITLKKITLIGTGPPARQTDPLCSVEFPSSRTIAQGKQEVVFIPY